MRELIEKSLVAIEAQIAEIRKALSGDTDGVVIPPDPPDPPPQVDTGRHNQAESYGVIIHETPMKPAWIARYVRHLPPAENRGKRNVYVDVLKPDGSRDKNPSLRINWSWEGRRPEEAAPPYPLDKGAGEPMGNIPLNAGQKMYVWITGDGVASDVVDGISSDHPDEGNGNTRFHHSFHIVFQKVV